jgi:hypothetical protein
MGRETYSQHVRRKALARAFHELDEHFEDDAYPTN